MSAFSTTALVGRQSRSNQSPPIVSAKREFFGIRPETFRDFGPEEQRPGACRLAQVREKPGFRGLCGAGCKPWRIAGLGGWRRSVDRTRLRQNSLQTGNFSGNSQNSTLRTLLPVGENLALQPVLHDFPTEVTGKIFFRNRRLGVLNRENLVESCYPCRRSNLGPRRGGHPSPRRTVKPAEIWFRLVKGSSRRRQL